MATRTCLHKILAEEAKARSYRRCGVGWVKDYGDLVAEIKLDRHKNVKGLYSGWISLYIKLDHVPQEYLENLEKFSPRMIHIYIPPARSPDKESHLLKLVNEPTIGPSVEENRELRARIQREFKLDKSGNLGESQAVEARRFMVEWGFAPLEICKTRADLAERFRCDEPPFGVFMRAASKYLT